MDMTLLAALPDDLKEKYNQLQAVLNAPGWKAVTEDTAQQLESTHVVIANANSWEEYHYSRGYRDALNQILGLESRIETDFTSAAEAQLEDNAEVTEEMAVGDFL